MENRLHAVRVTAPSVVATASLYLIEHRTRPHRREVIFQFIGTTSPMD